MKKLFSFISVLVLAATLSVSTVSAQKSLVTVEKLWSKTVAEIGSTTADTRQGAGKDGKVYLLNKANQSLVAISAEGQDTICVGPLTVAEGVTAKLDGTAYALDDAGNFVMEGTFPNKPSHLVLGKADYTVVKDLAITGLARTDYINAVGDVFSAEGGYVFLYGNEANLLVYKVANGELVGEPTTVAVAGVGAGNYVIAGDATTQIVHHRSSGGWKKIENGVATDIQGMEGHKNSTLGGDIFTLGGKEFFIYPAGKTGYSSEFAVRNMTDAVFVADKNGATIFCANTMDKNPGATSTACWLNVSKIDDDNAYIHVYNAADGVAVFKIAAIPAATITLNCDATMGTVEGAGDAAIGGKATIKAIPNLGYSFVCWLNGTDTVATTAEYAVDVQKDITLTAIFKAEANKSLKLAVNDPALGAITLPEGVVMGENSIVYGTEVALTVVPVEGCTFLGWFNGEELYSAEYTINVAMTADLDLTAKFVKVLKLSYELNGGVTNDFGWTSKGAVALDLQKDYNAAYSKSLEWAKEENGYIYYNVDDQWVREDLVPAGTASTVAGFIQYVTYNTSDNLKKLVTDTANTKYSWLYDIMVVARTNASLPVDDANMPENTYRKEISAFFLNSPADGSWPASPTYETMGNFDMFKAIWKHGFANPTDIVTEVTLNAPYKADFTFDGWYATADFSGDKITTVSPESNIAGGKLYAKWIEYIPNCEELWGMTPETTTDTVATKAAGTVTYVNGGQFYIQDNYAGMLCYTKDHGLVEGDVVTFAADLVLYNGYPELVNAKNIVKNGNKPVNAPVLFLSDLSATMKGYLFQIVTLQGLKLASAQDTKLFFVSSGDTVQYYNKAIKAADYTVGKTYDVTAVVTQYKGEVQLAGDPAKITRSASAAADPSVYAVIKAENENNPGDTITYTITSDWLYSVNMKNWNANKPNPVAEQCRGMVVKDGIIYFTYRSSNTPSIGDLKLVRYDAETGEKMDDLMLKEYIFREVADGSDSAKATRVDTDESTGIAYLKEDYKWNYEEFTSAAYVFGPNTDMRMDDAGNILVANLPTEGHVYQIWKIDEKTGDGELVVYMGGNSGVTDFAARFPDDPAIRLDRFDVVGDVTADAVIMAPSQNSSNVYEMDIFDGKWDGEGWHIICNNGDPAVAFSYSPRIEVVDDGEAFYVDGFATYPELFDIEGNLLESFNGTFDEAGESINPSCLELLYSKNAISSGTGVCGVHEFMCGGAYFFAMAGNSYEGSDTSMPSSTKVFRFKDGNRHFYEMMLAWELADNGFGNVKNAQFNYVQASVVVDELTTELYVYAAENGIGKYTIKASKSVEEETALDKVGAENNDVMKVVRDGKVYIVRNGVVYTIMGQMAE